jgi:hypothetical protein
MSAPSPAKAFAAFRRTNHLTFSSATMWASSSPEKVLARRLRLAFETGYNRGLVDGLMARRQPPASDSAESTFHPIG